MSITLLCQYSSGSVAFPAGLVEAVPAPERRYAIVNGTLTLDGYADAVLHHDADVLLQNPIYRLPTPAEQAQMAQATIAATSVTEQAPVPPVEDVPAPSKNKKNNEG